LAKQPSKLRNMGPAEARVCPSESISHINMPRLPTSILSSIRPRQTPQFLRSSFHSTAINMGVTKQVIKQGDGQTFPKNGDNVTMEYTGWLEENGKKGKQ
jgi:hypothetical protein